MNRALQASLRRVARPARRTGFFLALLLVAAAEPARATHFRYGHISWVSAANRRIEFTLQNAWRRSANPCVDVATLSYVTCSPGDGLPQPGDVIAEITGETALDPGDGSPLISSPLGQLLYLVTSIDPANDDLFGIALDPAALPVISTRIGHQYPANGQYTAQTTSCCRISTQVNNPDGAYSVRTVVEVGPRNASPTSSLAPIVNCPSNGLCSFSVLGSDPDGGSLVYRLSAFDEAGGLIQPGPPHAPNAATIDPVTGVYSWDTTGATLSASGETLYSTQVTFEDETGITAALDFLVRLVDFVPPLPVFDHPPTPACGSLLEIGTGGSIRFAVQASTEKEDTAVTLTVAGVPQGAVLEPSLPVSGNPAATTLSWHPEAGQTGDLVVNFTATDDDDQSVQCSVVLRARSAPRLKGKPWGREFFIGGSSRDYPNLGMRPPLRGTGR